MSFIICLPHRQTSCIPEWQNGAHIINISNIFNFQKCSDQIGAGIISVSMDFCYSAFSYTSEHSGTYFGDWWRVGWQTERVRPGDPSSLSAKSLSVPPRSHVNHLQPVSASCWHVAKDRTSSIGAFIQTVKTVFECNLISSQRALWYNMDKLQVIVWFILTIVWCQEVSWMTPPHQIPLYCLSRSQSVSSLLIYLSRAFGVRTQTVWGELWPRQGGWGGNDARPTAQRRVHLSDNTARLKVCVCVCVSAAHIWTWLHAHF